MDDLTMIAGKARDVLESNGMHFTGTDGPTATEVLLMVSDIRALRGRVAALEAENGRLRRAAADFLRAQDAANRAFGKPGLDEKMAAEDAAKHVLEQALGGAQR